MQNRQYPLIDNNLSEIKGDILTTLAYFDLFSYPLTRGEIYLFVKNKYEYSLRYLLNSTFIHKFDVFYTLRNDQYLIVRRNEGNIKAAELIKIAKKVADILIRFPYVRGIAISGSLSKNYADEYSDIDLFIITAKNRLWIARTIMHCFKKLAFLVRKEDYLCMNYYVDEQQLDIAEKNIYTAIEIGTLIPLQGDAVFVEFYTANSWTRTYLPNKTMRVSSAKPIKRSFFKSIIELLLNNALGNVIDNLLMKTTASRWLKKTQLKKLNSYGAVMGMKTGKHFSKPDPANFQSKLLTKYEGKVLQVLRQYENSLVH
jgi:predicted nucleotidyltransferase